jgi:hypothetical protein
MSISLLAMIARVKVPQGRVRRICLYNLQISSLDSITCQLPNSIRHHFRPVVYTGLALSRISSLLSYHFFPLSVSKASSKRPRSFRRLCSKTTTNTQGMRRDHQKASSTGKSLITRSDQIRDVQSCQIRIAQQVTGPFGRQVLSKALIGSDSSLFPPLIVIFLVFRRHIRTPVG